MAGEWTTTRLGQVVAINPDAIGRDWPYSHIRYIDISSVGVGQIKASPQWMKVSDAPSRAKRLVRKGDTVLSTVRPNRRSMFFASQPGDDWVVSTGFSVLRPKMEFIDPRFLYACVFNQSFTEYLITREKGAAYPAVSPEDIAKAEIVLPPLKEQQAIACILGALDDKIELNQRMNETLEAMARAISKSWFVDFDPVRAKAEGRQPPGLAPHITDLFPDAFEESELGEIPKGWRVGTLDSVSEKAQYGYTATATDELIGPRFLRIKDINKQDWIEWQNVPYCEIEKHKIDKYRLAKGDVVIARMADPGHGALIEDEIEAVFASYLIRFRPVRPELGRFLQYWLRSETYWNLVISRQSGTTRANLNAQVLSSFSLVVPDDKVLKAFASQVDALRSKLVANVNESRNLATLRDTLLPRLISGELRLLDAERIVGRCV